MCAAACSQRPSRTVISAAAAQCVLSSQAVVKRSASARLSSRTASASSGRPASASATA